MLSSFAYGYNNLRTSVIEAFGQAVATSGSSSSPYTFAATSGYRNDGDAGLTHVGARYYDAQVGRFITRDTELDQHPYLYCGHDPVNALDPSGHNPWPAIGRFIGDGFRYNAPTTPGGWGCAVTIGLVPATYENVRYVFNPTDPGGEGNIISGLTGAAGIAIGIGIMLPEAPAIVVGIGSGAALIGVAAVCKATYNLARDAGQYFHWW